MKKNIFFIVFFFSFLTAPLLANSKVISPKPLEVNYPPLPSVSPLSESVSLPDYVKYIYLFFLGISGFIALGVIIAAGFRYLTSYGMPERLREAKNQIASALLGLLILSTSWLILRTINPQLIIFREPGELPPILPDLSPGVYLCKQDVAINAFWDKRIAAETQPPDEQKKTAQELNAIMQTIKENCFLIKSEGRLPKEIEDQATFAYLVPVFRKQQYGVILYEERKAGGTAAARVLYGAKDKRLIKDLENPTRWALPSNFRPSSAVPFILNYQPKPSWYVRLYEAVFQNRNNPAYPSKTYQNLKQGAWFENISSIFPPPQRSKAGISQIGSLKIEGDYIVIFFKKPIRETEWTMQTEIDVFTKTDNNLYDNLMGKWNLDCVQQTEEIWGEDTQYPCAADMVIISGESY